MTDDVSGCFDILDIKAAAVVRNGIVYDEGEARWRAEFTDLACADSFHEWLYTRDISYSLRGSDGTAYLPECGKKRNHRYIVTFWE